MKTQNVYINSNSSLIMDIDVRANYIVLPQLPHRWLPVENILETNFSLVVIAVHACAHKCTICYNGKTIVSINCSSPRSRRMEVVLSIVMTNDRALV